MMRYNDNYFQCTQVGSCTVYRIIRMLILAYITTFSGWMSWLNKAVMVDSDHHVGARKGVLLWCILRGVNLLHVECTIVYMQSLRASGWIGMEFWWKLNYFISIDCSMCLANIYWREHTVNWFINLKAILCLHCIPSKISTYFSNSINLKCEETCYNLISNSQLL